MSTVVATGQITIVDNNDARPITSYITSSLSTYQVYSKDEDTTSYTPDWTSTANVLTAKVFIGGASGSVDITASLSSKKWSKSSDATSLGSGVTLNIATNLTEAVPSITYIFEGDYTDSLTGLVSHCQASIALIMVKTGTNSVYVITRGTAAIQESDGTTKNVAVICADLMRSNGHDTSGVTYQWFEANGVTQITTAQNTKYGLLTTADAAAPTGTAANIGANLPAASAWSSYNTLVINESAITDMGTLRVVAKDNVASTYQAYFTIYDVSDPYQTNILSSSGEKLQNGVGSTTLTPQVYNGSTLVPSLTGWVFNWRYYNENGNLAGFIDTTRTAVAGGRNITANTAGAAAVFTYDGAAITFAAGDMIKVVTAAGLAKYFEVASGTGNTVTTRTATVSTFLNAPFPATGITLSQFVGGRLFVCTGTGATSGLLSSSAGASITVNGDMIDAKGTIQCDSLRP